MSNKTKKTKETETRVIKASELKKLDLSNQESEEEIEDIIEPEPEPEEEEEETEVKTSKPYYKAVRTFKDSGKKIEAGTIYKGRNYKKFLKTGFLQVRG